MRVLSCLRISLLPIVALILMIHPRPAHALGESTARSTAMGGAYGAVARNLDAVGWNPANLGLSSDRKVSIAVFSLGVDIGNDTFSLSDYNDLNGRTWTEADRQRILQKIKGKGMKSDLRVEVRALGFSYGRYAFRMTALGGGQATLPKEPVELMLFGNQPGREYRVDATDGAGWGVGTISLSTARPVKGTRFKEFSVGGTVTYVRGGAYGKLIRSTGTLSTTGAGWRLRGDATARRSEGGNGVAFDIGASAALDDRWTAGLSLINVIGIVSWNRNNRENIGTVATDSLTAKQITSAEKFEDLFNPKDASRSGKSFSARLPAILRIGLARKAERLILAVDYEQGLNRVPGTTVTPRVSGGVEYRPVGWLPLRGGLVVGGWGGFSGAIGFGVGWRRFAFDWAVINRGGITPGSVKGLGVAMEMKVGW